MSAGSKAAFVLHEDELQYRFNDKHPFNPKRLELTLDLLRQAGALPPSAVVRPRPAAEDELLFIHAPDYVEAVRALSEPSPLRERLELAPRYGLDSQDTPFFPNMHQVTSTIVGGSVTAAEEVMSGRCEHALHLGGGLHHALADKGAGFCVYNDASVAIAYIRERYRARVLYIDTDVHHGDGVQWSFYTDPDVLTFSIHETGKYLFPGTGFAGERGQEDGFGYCVNLPMEPYTEDESWLECLREGLDRILAEFRPDVIVSQHGCDAHAYDPLAHIHCSMRIYRQMPAWIHQAAHDWCGGRWVALGGGGYDIWRVVPRAWSLLWLEMSEHPLARTLAEGGNPPLPDGWLAAWSGEASAALPTHWLDDADAWPAIPRRADITARNRQTTELALQYLPRRKR